LLPHLYKTKACAQLIQGKWKKAKLERATDGGDEDNTTKKYKQNILTPPFKVKLQKKVFLSTF
jgi:hypothetical protein